MMRIGEAHISRKIRSLSGLVVFLWLSVFSGAFVLQVLHNHTEANETASCEWVKPGKQEQVVHKATLKCAVCDYLHHHQQKDFLTISGLEVSFFSPIQVKPVVVYTAGISKLSFYAWTNKGPPVQA